MPATRAAAAADKAVTSGRDSTAPAARAPAGDRQPEASSGRREVDGTASGQATPAVTPVDPTAAALTTADTATGGRRGAAAVEASTTATAENSTAATAVAAAAVAEVEDTAADSESGLRARKVASGRRYTSSLISIYNGYLFLSNFIPQLFSFCLLLFQKK